MLGRINRHLIVTTKLVRYLEAILINIKIIFFPTTLKEEPYVMGSISKENEYFGFCIELLNRISNACNFSYEIKLVHDGFYGVINENGKWNGIVGEIMDHVRDFFFTKSVSSFMLPF